jgi:hypothetical protein
MKESKIFWREEWDSGGWARMFAYWAACKEALISAEQRGF